MLGPQLVDLFGLCCKVSKAQSIPSLYLVVELQATDVAPCLSACCQAAHHDGHWTLTLWNHEPQIKQSLL